MAIFHINKKVCLLQTNLKLHLLLSPGFDDNWQYLNFTAQINANDKESLWPYGNLDMIIFD